MIVITKPSRPRKTPVNRHTVKEFAISILRGSSVWEAMEHSGFHPEDTTNIVRELARGWADSSFTLFLSFVLNVILVLTAIFCWLF